MEVNKNLIVNVIDSGEKFNFFFYLKNIFVNFYI